MYPELMTKDPLNSPLMGLLKIDQLAFIARNDEDEAMIKKQLRLSNAAWVEDEVVARGYVRADPASLNPTPDRNQENTAKLLFNYDMGVEVEILRYTEGRNYADVGGVESGHLCHIGAHVEKGKQLPEALANWTLACPIIQQVETLTHTNPFLVETGRKYRYTIYDTKDILGVYFKVIERLEAAS